MDIPSAIPLTQWNSDVNWRYRTEPSDSYCLGMKNHSCYWPRGKVMGGSSTLNYMIATRGHPKDYDHWAEMGNQGWSYEDVLPYFKKLEDVDYLQVKDEGLHGRGGPVPIRHPPFFTPISEAFVQAGVELGYKVVDYNGIKQTGFSHLQTNIKDGYRFSSNKAYLHPARYRKNLIVSKNSMVIKIIFNDDNTRAIGVEYKKSKRIYRVYAKKEVIISAGSINSPQLLMLSGIGPVDNLKEFNIKPIADLPVGENLMDHIAYGTLIFKLNQPVALNFNEVSDLSNPYVRDFLLKKSGPLAIPNGCESIAFVDVDNFTGQEEYPNLEFLFLSGTVFTNFLFPHIWGIADDVWAKMLTKIDVNGHYITIFPMILRPKSRGRILLKSASPYRQPRIIPNYLSDKDDVRVLVSGIKKALKVTETETMQKFGAKLVHFPFKGCEHLDRNSDEYWECALRTITFNIYHYSGTCKMGPQNDPSAVVNSRLQVHGIDGLRVGDASIMPSIPSGHTNIPTFMIAEKLADMIKADWGLSTKKR
ncbi:glucose dehydrogenase [FAD, quinone]-like isoform X2 [Chelonus insularis]|nr:glucose dehydrogenase [FAD, quinone]-like isoform X2 [Chelonus insularis]